MTFKNTIPFLVLLVAVCLAIPTKLSAQNNVLVLDQDSFKPVQEDLLTGLPIDPIPHDYSNRPCARLKIHLNRITLEEIRDIEVCPLGGNIVVMSCRPASDADGLIIELTASPKLSFYLHHPQYGDSNLVTCAVEGDKEYFLSGYSQMTFSINVLSETIGAEVFLDNKYQGVISQEGNLTLRDVQTGKHELMLADADSTMQQEIQVDAGHILFNINFPEPQPYWQLETGHAVGNVKEATDPVIHWESDAEPDPTAAPFLDSFKKPLPKDKLIYGLNFSVGYQFKKGMILFQNSGYQRYGNLTPMNFDFFVGYQFTPNISLAAGLGIDTNVFTLKEINEDRDSNPTSGASFDDHILEDQYTEKHYSRLDVPVFAKVKANTNGLGSSDTQVVFAAQGGYYVLNKVYLAEVDAGVGFAASGEQMRCDILLFAKTTPWPEYQISSVRALPAWTAGLKLELTF